MCLVVFEGKQKTVFWGFKEAGKGCRQTFMLFKIDAELLGLILVLYHDSANPNHI